MRRVDSSRLFPSKQQKAHFPKAFFLLLLVLVIGLSGCWKEKRRGSTLNSEQAHEITGEMAAAARHASPPGTVIRWKQGTTPRGGPGPDHMEIVFFGDEKIVERRSDISTVIRALQDVAETHGLETTRRKDSKETAAVSFRSGLLMTQTIMIHAVQKSQPAGGTELSPDAPRLAIILDDLGSDRVVAEDVFALSCPLTISVLPNKEHSTDIAEEAFRRDYQVMLHLPMESVAEEAPEPKELHPGMRTAEVRNLLNTMIDSVPNAVGVNNHQGSQATSDSRLMRELMPALKERGLFYVDSRTTAATIAFDTARHEGIPAAFRNVPFLDDVQDVASVRAQLQQALQGAKEKKSAIAIGHPHPATLEALREFLPKANAAGVRLVFVSDLVH